MIFDDIKNDTTYREFKDISSEDYRKYIYPGIPGLIVEDKVSSIVNTIEVFISDPIGLSVSKSGHYVIDSRGYTHFMPFGFVQLTWKPKKDNPNIVI